MNIMLVNGVSNTSPLGGMNQGLRCALCCIASGFTRRSQAASLLLPRVCGERVVASLP